MCINHKRIRNPYTGLYQYVPCGKCPACLQKKANRRKRRLLNNHPQDYDVFFFKLSYSHEYVPYFYAEDCVLDDPKVNFITVYRMQTYETYYDGFRHCNVSRVNQCETELFDFPYTNLTSEELNSFYFIQSEYVDEPDKKVAVLWYPDVQLFFKRLRSRLSRNVNVAPLLDKKPIQYFVTGEYGETNSRAHWHVLLYVPRLPIYDENLRLNWWQNAIISCWPYARDYVTRQRFEFAISPEKYVAQYVNASVDVSRFLLRGKIRPTWHYSHYFGFDNSNFELPSLLESFRANVYSYPQIYPLKNGFHSTVTVPFPPYVTNRYFPKFKGMRCLSYDDIKLFIPSLTNKYRFAERMRLTYEECRDIHKFLMRKYENYNSITHLSMFDYVRDYISSMRARAHELYTNFYDVSTERDMIQNYDNIIDFKASEPTKFKLSFGNYDNSPFIVECNKFDRNIQETLRLEDDYNKYVKTKKLNSQCLKN